MFVKTSQQVTTNSTVVSVVQNIEFILIETGFAVFALFALATRVSPVQVRST